VAVVGGGVVGCAVAHALARRGVECVLLEADTGLALSASGTNSGIMHTGFDSHPGELETQLIVRAAELRERLLGELGIEPLRCGARLRPAGPEQQAAVVALAENAARNGVAVTLESDGSLRVPGEAVVDPVAYVHALAAAARDGGASIRLGARVEGLRAGEGGIAVAIDGARELEFAAVVNCAGLRADEVARLAGDEPVEVYPRKGEFLVFAPADGERLTEILLPVPSALGKGVLVFPTTDGHVIAGPTAREREDKDDWSVEADAGALILERARAMYPPLRRCEPVGAYAGLRPAGRGANYVIAHSRAISGVVHVAAIRSTGLSASLAIGEHVAAMLDGVAGVELGEERELAAAEPAGAPQAWWERAARHHQHTREETQT